VSVTLPVPSTRDKLTILGIVLVGLVLRLWTIGYGIPYTPGIDEPVIMEKALNMMKTGDFNPHFFDYGGLTIYLQMAVASVKFAAGALSREWASLDKVWEGDFYLWGRTATALLGTLTIYLVYRAGLRWGWTVALVASSMMAIHPHLVREAHYALTDTPLTFFLALTLLLSLVAAEDGRLRWFALAGLTAGLATATKYNGSLGLLMPICAALASPAVSFRSASAVLAIGGLVVGFLVAAPYSLLDLPNFLNGFASLAQHYNKAQSGMAGARIYFTHIRLAFSLGPGWSWPFAWPALLLCLAGAATVIGGMRSRERRAPALILVVFPLAYFWLIAEQSLIFARYALPIAPMLCLVLGIGIVTAHELIRTKVAALHNRDIALALLIVVAIPPAIQAVKWDYDRLKTGTDELMARWLRRNVRPEDRIVGEPQAIRLPPGFHYEYRPRLIRESVEAYRAENVAYLVLDSGIFTEAMSSPSEVAAYRALLASTEAVKTIEKSSANPGPALTVLKIPKQ
jgi:4-amino-4-deoxy-L-arabinose transferase-like glycosyltransferase